LFIDRDSDRFRFCLDYMRAPDKVWLPLNIPKEAILDDLDFYGFEDVDPSKIHGGSSNLAAARHLSKCKEEHEKFLATCKRNAEAAQKTCSENVNAAEKTCRENVKATKTTSECEEFAYACFVRFSRGDSLQMFFSTCPNYAELFNRASVALANKAEFDDHLAKYGLAFVKRENIYPNGFTLELIEKEDTIN
jgi:hypothetical protein